MNPATIGWEKFRSELSALDCQLLTVHKSRFTNHSSPSELSLT